MDFYDLLYHCLFVYWGLKYKEGLYSCQMLKLFCLANMCFKQLTGASMQYELHT